MSLTVQECLDQIKHATGAKTLSPELVEMSVINDAGACLHAMHHWEWAVPAEYSLDLVANQNYIVLPTDFAEAISVEHVESLVNSFDWIDRASINRLRTTQIDVTAFFYRGCLEWVVPITGGAPVPRIAIWPTPTAAATGAFKLFYRRAWVSLGGAEPDTTYLNIPWYIDPLFRRLVRLHALAWEESENAVLEDRLEKLEASAFLDRIKEHDGGAQPELGELEGGAAQSYTQVRNYDNPVADPSSS